MAFSPDYVRLVLNDVFEDGKQLFLDPLMDIHYAHLVMLTDQGIVGAADARTLRAALDGIDRDAVRRAAYDGTCEDLFFYLERLIVEACGPDVAGHLHTARSRNDIDMALYRLRLREALLDVAGAAIALRRALVGVAGRHVETLFPAHTHTQPAQPSTVAHYLLAIIEELERDAPRLAAAYESTNRCPLGACAITGTGFPIDRERTAELLGFSGATGNTYGSIATVDYLLESAAAMSVTVLGVGRFVQDMLLWCTREVGYLRLPDGFVQISSIMPQKRNPVALEHARAIASKAVAQLAAIPAVVHNTPFGDIVDTEDDLQPLVTTAARDAVRAVSLVAAAMAEAEFDVARMRARAGEGFVTITELADALARDHGLSFREAHGVATRMVQTLPAGSIDQAGAVLAQASRDVTGREIRIADADLARILSPEHFVAVRRTPGGPAPDVVRAALADSTARLEADTADVARRRAALADAARARHDAVARL
ncbi:MAG: argininosuccinate lyase [Vicinamibacterales bacterium]